MSYSDNVDVSSIRTYILVAWIVAILALAAWVISFVYYFVYFFIVLGLLNMGPHYAASYYYNPGTSIFIGIGLGYGIFFLIFTIPSILVFRRISRMRSAVNQGDMEKLKQLNTTTWAIISLIFAGVIPGIMLLLAHSQMTGTRAPSSKGVSNDNLDKMAKLKSLLDSGAITKEEFESQKSSLLNPQVKQTSQLEDKLTKLKSLYDSGTLTESEYNDEKKKLLSDL